MGDSLSAAVDAYARAEADLHALIFDMRSAAGLVERDTSPDALTECEELSQ